MSEVALYGLGEKMSFRWENGPVSFGWVVAGAVVSWSAPRAHDLLVTRCWEGVFLYPSRSLDDQEINREPIKVCDGLVYLTRAYPADWNRDGRDELILTDRPGFLYLADKKGDYPGISFPKAEPLRDCDEGLPFNIPWENPDHPELSDEGGYIDPQFYNYTYPVVYPMGGMPGTHLIVGDLAGNLWWLPDTSGGVGLPRYRGLRYAKTRPGLGYGKRYLAEHGREYAKPRERICDERGVPHRLGVGMEAGVSFEGGNARPVLYRNPETGSDDLLVIAGHVRNTIFYLERTNPRENGAPIFRNRGEVTIRGADVSRFGPHSPVIVPTGAKGADLFIPSIWKLGVFRNAGYSEGVPCFVFDRWVSGPDARACGYNYTELLKDGKGRRYLLDNPTRFELYEVKGRGAEVRLAADPVVVVDQSGPFVPESETDVNLAADWGFHRAALWDFDGSGRQHLIVGTDKGLLWLLVDESGVGEGGFRFRSVGPLRDRAGKVIRVHNRACAAGIDLDGDGREDLVVGGVTYQMGMKTDPNPGGGIYSILNLGSDQAGLPRLDVVRPLPLAGYEVPLTLNQHVQIQALDLDGDGAKELVVAGPMDGYRGNVFRPSRDRIGLEFTGTALPRLCIEERVLDVDGDGRWEYVFSGGENGIGYYQKIGEGKGP